MEAHVMPLSQSTQTSIIWAAIHQLHRVTVARQVCLQLNSSARLMSPCHLSRCCQVAENCLLQRCESIYALNFHWCILPFCNRVYATSNCLSGSINSADFYLQNHCFPDGDTNTSVAYNFPTVQLYDDTVCTKGLKSQTKSAVCLAQTEADWNTYALWSSITAPTPSPTQLPSAPPTVRPTRLPTFRPTVAPSSFAPTNAPHNPIIVTFNLTYVSDIF